MFTANSQEFRKRLVVVLFLLGSALLMASILVKHDSAWSSVGFIAAGLAILFALIFAAVNFGRRVVFVRDENDKPRLKVLANERDM